MIAIPWPQIVDAVIGVAKYASRSRAGAAATPPLNDDQQQLEASSRVPGSIEARMAGVVVAG